MTAPLLRVWRTLATPLGASRYLDHFDREVLPVLTRTPGFLGATVLRRSSGDHLELVVATGWASDEAVRGFAGAEPLRAVIDPAARELLIEPDELVTHFEVARRAGPEPV